LFASARFLLCLFFVNCFLTFAEKSLLHTEVEAKDVFIEVKVVATRATMKATNVVVLKICEQIYDEVMYIHNKIYRMI
jgi:hypothetical protein